MATTHLTEHKSFEKPEEVREFPHGRDLTSLPSGHDAWVLGDEPVVVVDFYGASTYAKGH
ncbi:MAG: hypothetical protein DLM67_06940 [Candidatus Nephthysia bennettiae]|uniref:Sulfurtransferase n=1 Tax=Candidatus Nephthysia bennettiae TaxID=3127016 RepID=A0A934NFI2_9BACT|nr:hypothetical protein [Candidatus Dormibacteraeota bacterium]MBJ7614168.1 hypothetical protein [Candidatus Dormibacteraeota bacterium]PZR97825.1 MAG: hypothetical protein DLM67_06940 [Candidatus Dormibacteraeota bacterium]